MSFCLAYLSTGGTDGKLLGAAMIGSICGVYLFYRGFRILQRKRLLENTPTSKIRGAALGLIEVNGLATGPHTIAAPVTGAPCFYYRSLAWQLKRSGKNEHWEKVADESLHVPFYIDDNTGTMLVDPQGAEMDIHRDFCETYNNSLFSSSIGVPSGVAGFLARYSIDCDKKTKVEEFCIKPKNCLFILGTLSQNHGVAVDAVPVRGLVTNLPKFVQEPSHLSFQAMLPHSGKSILTGETISSCDVVRVSGNHVPDDSSGITQDRLASALLSAGISNPAAWAAAGMTNMAPIGTSSPGSSRPGSATSEAGSGTAVATALEPFDLHPPTVLMKGAGNPEFYISWRSQRDILQSMRWKSFLMIWGGPALTLLSMYILSTYFGGF